MSSFDLEGDKFELEIDEQSRIGSEYMAKVVNEIRRAISAEKKVRKITQQAIAEKIGTSRAVVNRQVQGLENLSARRIAEILWAIGWEPHFEARKIPLGENFGPATELFNTMPNIKTTASTTGGTTVMKELRPA